MYSAAAFTLGDRSVLLTQWLRGLHAGGRLVPLLQEAAVAAWLEQQAAESGLSVSTAELQQAADGFRRHHGLNSTEQTTAWLAASKMSVLDFEAALQRDLLAQKLREQVTAAQIPRHFEAERESFARVRLRQIVVPREDLARELLSQIQEEGRDFAEVARRHSHHASRMEGGAVGNLPWRRQLPPELAERLFTAQAGEIIGPVANPQGFQLFLVEEIRPPELDPATTAFIRQELFEAWLADQLRGVNITFPVLEMLSECN